MYNKLKSRKFWLTIAAMLLVLVNEGFNLDIPEETYWALVLPVIAYVFGESYVDARK